MKWEPVFIGLLVIIAGVMPIVAPSIGIPESFTTGYIYAGIIVLIGIIGIVISLRQMSQMMAGSKTMTVILSLLTIVGGLIPLLRSLIPGLSFLGFLVGLPYQILIIVVGVVALIFGAIAQM
jgi:hypothetical protein